MYSIMFLALHLVQRQARPRPSARRQALIVATATSLKLCARPVPRLKMPDSRRPIEEVQVHRDHVFDRDEVAPLLAVGVAVRSPGTA